MPRRNLPRPRARTPANPVIIPANPSSIPPYEGHIERTAMLYTLRWYNRKFDLERGHKPLVLCEDRGTKPVGLFPLLETGRAHTIRFSMQDDRLPEGHRHMRMKLEELARRKPGTLLQVDLPNGRGKRTSKVSFVFWENGCRESDAFRIGFVGSG